MAPRGVRWTRRNIVIGMNASFKKLRTYGEQSKFQIILGDSTVPQPRGFRHFPGTLWLGAFGGPPASHIRLEHRQVPWMLLPASNFSDRSLNPAIASWVGRGWRSLTPAPRPVWHMTLGLFFTRRNFSTIKVISNPYRAFSWAENEFYSFIILYI